MSELGSMEKEIQEAIAKNLPAAVGTELKKRLEQAEKDAANLKLYKEKYEALGPVLSKAQSDLANLQAAETDLKKREKEVSVREASMQKLELRAQYEQEKTGLVLGMFETVFKNRIVRETALVQRESVSRQEYQGGGSNESRCPMQVEETKTTEHE